MKTLNDFESIVYKVFSSKCELKDSDKDNISIPQLLNKAFLILLSGNNHPDRNRAKVTLKIFTADEKWNSVARFYMRSIESVRREMELLIGNYSNPEFNKKLKELNEWISVEENIQNKEQTIQKLWNVFFPEGTNLLGNEESRIKTLRDKRTVDITELNSNPINNPAEEILFTSNVLLTIPDSSIPVNELPFSQELKDELNDVIKEDQKYWFDHPIQIGVNPESNEILYGMRGLQEAIEFEIEQKNAPDDSRLTCVLSTSVTHEGIKSIVNKYLEEEFKRSKSLDKLDIFVFTEEDTSQVIKNILVPAAKKYLNIDDTESLLNVFGVDGEYGRHYSFLKAISALWHVLVNPKIKATFKIDLDQVFPQEVLVKETGSSMFGHFKTPLWGAKGNDSDGHPMEFGLIAGALVNESDIEKSLFTPDVNLINPDREIEGEDEIFFSTLTHALSTEAEMMVRYNTDEMDGKNICLQRIHVTGGTNGILVDSLFKHRPFTPSFIARAEDQAYIMSVITNPERRLGYVHKDGLIMRHDKEAFAAIAIKSASFGNLVSSYIRTLLFSEYANVLGDLPKIKDLTDPFTGCFISYLPITVSCLRFAVKACDYFNKGNRERGDKFVLMGSERVGRAMEFTSGENSELAEQYKKEKDGWDLYYNILAELKTALNNNDKFALELCDKTKKLIEEIKIK